MLSFIFFHMTQAFANFTSIKYDELYTLAIIVEKLYFIGGLWLPELTKHKHLINAFHIVSHPVLKWFKAVSGALCFITWSIEMHPSWFPSLWKQVWENHLKKDFFGSGFSSLSPGLFGILLCDCSGQERHSRESLVKQNWPLQAATKAERLVIGQR